MFRYITSPLSLTLFFLFLSYIIQLAFTLILAHRLSCCSIRIVNSSLSSPSHTNSRSWNTSRPTDSSDVWCGLGLTWINHGEREQTWSSRKGARRFYYTLRCNHSPLGSWSTKSILLFLSLSPCWFWFAMTAIPSHSGIETRTHRPTLNFGLTWTEHNFWCVHIRSRLSKMRVSLSILVASLAIYTTHCIVIKHKHAHTHIHTHLLYWSPLRGHLRSLCTLNHYLMTPFCGWQLVNRNYPSILFGIMIILSPFLYEKIIIQTLRLDC